MEFLKDCLEDLFLFSGIEGIIYAMWYHLVCGCKKFKWYQILIMSVGNCLISKIFIPCIYQVLMVLWMGSLLFGLNDNLTFSSALRKSALGLTLFLFTEIPYSFILEYLNVSDVFNPIYYNKMFIFILLIPINIIKIIIIKTLGGTKMKTFIGKIKKRKIKVVK